jgi:hypothetical protein
MSDFSTLAQHHFEFLVTVHEFWIETSGDRLVTYSNGKLFIQVGQGRMGETGLTLDRYPPSNFFPFTFYLATIFPDNPPQIEESPTRSKFELDAAIGRLARLARDFGKPFFERGPEVMDLLETRALDSLR